MPNPRRCESGGDRCAAQDQLDQPFIWRVAPLLAGAGGRAMFEVYRWDTLISRFCVEGVFEHRGAAEVVAGRLAARTGNPHFVRVRTA